MGGGATGEVRGGATGELSGGATGEDTETESSSVRAMASSPQLRFPMASSPQLRFPELSIFALAATTDPLWPMERRLWL